MDVFHNCETMKSGSLANVEKAIVLGTGGHARALIATANLIGRYELMGILDRTGPTPGETIMGLPVIGLWNDLWQLRGMGITSAYLALGNNATRREMFQRCEESGLKLPALVHPSAFVDPTAHIGDGALVCGGAFIGPEVEIGKGVIVNTGSSVDHESIIEDFVTVSPGVVIAGRVVIGQNAFLGIGACISDNVSIGSGARVGAGAIALKDIPENVLVVGVPACIKSTDLS
ncbi:hexapeptide transferase [Algimonas arctica]|uniref:Hexapeptide transferase n=1 Tax=Algimonas arctica TaxID=1479486 RepID=A0A8J3CNW8_9PROT|nr:acetyltransferase [Algimonas arctica]GHA85086.1 hexapeptide transferase [Algimonas arctica]